jgi:hypothetical protein
MRTLILKIPLKGGVIHGFKWRTIVPFFAAFLIGHTVSQAANYEFRAGGISLWLPDDWGVDLAAKTMTGFSKSREAFVKLSLITDAENLNAAFLKYLETLRPDITAYRETQARNDTAIAGGEGLSAGGEGIADGSQKRIRVVVFKAARAFIVLAWSVTEGKMGQYQPVFERIVNGIKQGSSVSKYNERSHGHEPWFTIKEKNHEEI